MKFVFAVLALVAVATASELISEGELEAHFNLFKVIIMHQDKQH